MRFAAPFSLQIMNSVLHWLTSAVQYRAATTITRITPEGAHLMKRVTALILTLGLLVGLAACGGGSGDPPPLGALSAAPSGTTRTQLRLMYDTEVQGLDYLRTGSAAELALSANLIDGLVEYDTYGAVVPALAQQWEHNEDATEWTFSLRQGVQWVDAAGRQAGTVTAGDWVSSASYVLDAANNCAPRSAYLDMIQNAAAYYEQTAAIRDAESAVQSGLYEDLAAYYAANEIDPSVFTLTIDDVGVRAQDDLTLVFTLENSCVFFPAALSEPGFLPVYGPFLEQVGAQFGSDNNTILYNGAFLAAEFVPSDHRTLVKNPVYWDAANVHIERLEWRYDPDAALSAPEYFLQDEIDDAPLDAETAAAWLNDPLLSHLVSPARADGDTSYVYLFNFEPRFDSIYEPENWSLAVNNENFRVTIYAGLDRVNALAANEPYHPAAALNSTVTPPRFAAMDGKDYTQYDPLLPFAAGDSFDEAAARNHRDLAIDELTAVGCTFPIQIFMPYPAGDSALGTEYHAVEQQLEALLGTDFIDVIVAPDPQGGFERAVRDTGAYGLMKCALKAAYADPQAFAELFAPGSACNFMYPDAQQMPGGIPADNKGADMQALVSRYYELAEAAAEITDDAAARYEAFAKAEAYLISHAIVIPFSVSVEGYRATRLNVFEGQYAPFGSAPLRYKSRFVYETPVSMDRFAENLSAWNNRWAMAK